MHIRRLLIFLSLLVALALGVGPAPALAATSPPYPAALGAFNPNGIVPGQWHLVRKTGVLYLNSGLLAGCHGAGARWQREDGTQVRFIWAACGREEIKLLSSTYASTRARIPAAWRNLSVLGANVDLVTGADGGAWRYWLQGNFSLALLAICPHQAIGACAGLSAPAARYLAARLPGHPVVTKVAAVFPPASPLLGALVVLWLMVVGGDRLSKRAKLEKFHMVAGSQKLLSVDQAAKDLRKTSRRRWWGKLFLVTGAVLLATGAATAARQGLAQAAGELVISLILVTVGLVVLRSCRDPLLSRGRYRAWGTAGEVFHIRRMLSAGLTLILGLLSLLVPLVVLAGWVLAGLSSDEQDLSSILAGVVILAVIACYFLDRAAQRLRARSLQEAMRRDPDRSLLYLRNFGDDAQKIPTSRFNRRGVWQRASGWLNPIGNARFEEVLTRALARSGPVVAIGQPGGQLHTLFSAIAPTLGAAKTTLAHDDWQDRVRQLATEAWAVLVSATPSQVNDGFATELKMLAECIGHGRIILVFGTGPKAVLHNRFGAFLRAVSAYPLFQDLASGWISDGALVLVHTPADGWGTWRGWGAERRTAWTYTAAIGAAVAYAQEAWSRPPAQLIPPLVEPTG